VYFFSVTAYFR